MEEATAKRCQHCGKPATICITHARKPGELYLCVDCNLKSELAESLEFQRLAHQMNFVAAAFEATSGLPGLVPRMPVPQIPPFRVGDMKVHNINVDNSVVGVLNTGSIQTVDNAVTVLKRRGADEIGLALAEFTQRVIDANNVDNETKNRVVEILSAVAEEATKPEGERRLGVIRPLLLELSTAVSGLADLAQLWQQYGPLILEFFGYVTT
jgi:hypothetical protein